MSEEVFISYKREESTFAEALAEALRRRGFTVWWDTALVPSDVFRQEITDRLGAARAVVVLWCGRSIDPKIGRWVIDEAEEALRLNKYVPALIEPVLPPLGLRGVQAQDLAAWDKTAEASLLEPLVVRVADLVGRKAVAIKAQVVPAGGIVVGHGASATHASLQAAVDAAPEGARILVQGGIYRERVVIRKRVHLVGDGAGPTRPRIESSDAQTIFITAGGPRIENLIIENDGEGIAVRVDGGDPKIVSCAISTFGEAPEGGNRGTVYVAGDATPVVSDCAIGPSVQNGVQIRDNAKARVERNSFVNVNYPAIAASGKTDSTIRENNIRDCAGNAIWIGGEARGVYERNTIARIALGAIVVEGEANPVVRDNQIQETPNGIKVAGAARGVYERNHISKTNKPGVHVSGTANCVVTGNTVEDSAANAIAVQDTAQVLFEKNTVRRCGDKENRYPVVFIAKGATATVRDNAFYDLRYDAVYRDEGAPKAVLSGNTQDGKAI